MSFRHIEASTYTCLEDQRCHPQDGLALRAANDSSIATFGTRSLTLDLGLSRIFTWIFIIAAVKRPILGADFLKHYGLAVDVKCQKLLDSMTQCKVQGAPAPEPSLNLTLLPAKSDNVFEALLQEFPSVIQSLNEQTPIKHNVTHHIITSGSPIWKININHHAIQHTYLSLIKAHVVYVCYTCIYQTILRLEFCSPSSMWMVLCPYCTMTKQNVQMIFQAQHRRCRVSLLIVHHLVYAHFIITRSYPINLIIYMLKIFF